MAEPNTNTQDIYRAVFKGYSDVLDVKQASSILSVSTKTIYRLLARGKLNRLK